MVAALGAELRYTNPVLPGDFPDPSVIRVGADYWATATTSEWAPLFPILHSRDLVHWEHVANAFDKRPAWSVGNYWAPEIATHDGSYFMYYVGRKTNGPLSVAVATAEKPSGPWTDHGPFISQPAGSIDPVPVTDEQGRRWLIWKEDGNSRKLPTVLWTQKLSDDGLRLEGEMKEIMRNDAPWEGAVIEGPFVVRHGDWFYLFYSGNACCGRNCNYALGVARAKKLLGPWEKNSANPILGPNDTWKCPGHGSVVRDPRGRDFLLYHAYHNGTFIYVGRQGLLDPIDWTGDWPTINGGKGPGGLDVGLPTPRRNRRALPEFFDDFTSAKLRPQWQWPQNNEPVATIESGHLRLSAASPELGRDVMGAVLAVHSTTGDYTATTLVDVSKLEGGASAGLFAYGDKDNALGMAITRGKATVWRKQRGEQVSISTFDVPSISRLQLRMTATDGHRFRFSLSEDGRQWKNVGGSDVEGEHLPPWDRGIRIALTAGGAENASAQFDWLRVQPTVPAK